jgi:hypothetical protein|tara:strand:+ start:10 stop:132 length:123 start_codon:yes stop_codon:yes gene_type:complete
MKPTGVVLDFLDIIKKIEIAEFSQEKEKSKWKIREDCGEE